MTTKTLTSPSLITKAETASGAIEEVIRKASDHWSAAYVAVAKDRKSGATADTIAKSLPAGSGCKSPATITDMERAASMAHPDAWAALWRLPVSTNGARVITLHGLIAKARKSAKSVKPVDAAIAKALDAVAAAANADDEGKRAARVARAYSGLVSALHGMKAEEVPSDPPADPPADPGDVDNVETETEAEPPTIDGRVLALAEECARLRAILTGGGASVKRESLAALVREAGELSRDVSRILDAHASKRAAG